MFITGNNETNSDIFMLKMYMKKINIYSYMLWDTQSVEVTLNSEEKNKKKSHREFQS